MTKLDEAIQAATDALDEYYMVDEKNPPYVEDWAGLARTMSLALEELRDAATPEKNPHDYEYGIDSLWEEGYIRTVSDSDPEDLKAYAQSWEGRKAYRRLRGSTDDWEELT